MSDNITPNFYSIIPADLWYDNRLKATEKLLHTQGSEKSKGVEYASDFDTIKRWVIDRVNEIEQKENKKQNTNNIKNKNYNNFKQREYSKEFLKAKAQIGSTSISSIIRQSIDLYENVGSLAGHHLHFEIRKKSNMEMI